MCFIEASVTLAPPLYWLLGTSVLRKRLILERMYQVASIGQKKLLLASLLFGPERTKNFYSAIYSQLGYQQKHALLQFNMKLNYWSRASSTFRSTLPPLDCTLPPSSRALPLASMSFLPSALPTFF